VDNLEIIFKNFPRESLDKFVNTELLNPQNKIRSSNFFDNINKKSLELEDISSVSNILIPIGSGSISFSDFNFGTHLENPVVTLSFDESLGDIVINFEIKTFLSKKEPDIINKCRKIIETALQFKKKYSIPIILIGFEPAEDKDTCLLHIDANGINLIEATKKLSSTLLKYLSC
jgi:hypothetical protein